MRTILHFLFFSIQTFTSMAQPTEIETALEKIIAKTVDGKKIKGVSFAIKKGDFYWQGAAGNLQINDQYFIASCTKLFTTAIIMQLRSSGKISLEDRISKYIDPDIMKGLLIYKGKDYSGEITVRHLLAHTSGLPDYFSQKGSDNKILQNEITSGIDQQFTFEQAMERTKLMKPLFKPGSPNKANYSDANFQLLGKIIEKITRSSFKETCTEMIIHKLRIEKTYVYSDPADRKPKNINYKNQELSIPFAMSSTGPDGGIVSTSGEMIKFIEAFFTGQLFPIEYIKEMQEWNRIFFPFKYGIGIQYLKLPWFFDPTGGIPAFIGHTGLSGSVSFYAPKYNIFITGTTNQAAHPDKAVRLMIQLIMKSVK